MSARRPVAALRYRPVGLHAHDVRRRDAKDIAVDRRRVVGVIEHEEIGELFLAQFPRHVVEREQRHSAWWRRQKILRLLCHITTFRPR